ncbi:MAG: hypothetical protein FWD79_05595 [Desulfobulbus sp.]|nr:hypothetical protein [Desulfobulbus sp.]
MTIDPTAHPADLIDRAHAMVHFLGTILGESREAITLNNQDTDGMCCILGDIEEHLKTALTKL